MVLTVSQEKGRQREVGSGQKAIVVNPATTAVQLVRQDASAGERRPLELIFMLAGMLAITVGIAASRLHRR